MPNPFVQRQSILRDAVLHRAHFHGQDALPESCGQRPVEVSRTPLFATLVFCAICTSCGAVGSSSPPPPVIVSISPSSAQPFQGESVQFEASVQNASNTAVTWQVTQTPPGNSALGTIDSNGLYTAPAAVPTPATVTVTAISQSDSTKNASASVIIQSLSSITGTLVVSPPLSSLTITQSLQLQIKTPGVTNNDVKWEATGGTITTAGVYTPPNTQGAYTVKATLIANPNTIGTAQVDVTTFPGTLTWRNDNARSGVNSQELALSPATVSSSTFGKLFSCPIDGYAYAQPLYVPNLKISGVTYNVVFVATEYDSVFAFDADDSSCHLLWKQAGLIPDGSQHIATPNLNITSSEIVPFVGITGTPVIGSSAQTLYVVAAMQMNGASPFYSQRLYALDLSTGNMIIERAGRVIETPPGFSTTFFPTLENQRPALLLDPAGNGTVYVAFGSYGEEGDYHGWLFEYDASSLQQTGVFVVTQSPAVQGGIWQSGGGPSEDSNGNIFVATGAGPFNANRTLENFSYGDSFLRLGTAGGLSVSDYFTPCDEGASQIVGTGAPVLLPDSAGSALQPHLLIGGSKGVSTDGALYVVNRDSMGGFCPASSVVQAIPVGAGPILSTPLFWNNAVYVAPGNGNLMAFPMLGGTLASAPAAEQSPETLGPQGATPVISSNGTSGAILWLIDSSGAITGGPAILRAYDPNHLSNELYSSPTAASAPDAAGPAVKFTVPTVANGKVYIGTQTELDVYGLK